MPPAGSRGGKKAGRGRHTTAGLDRSWRGIRVSLSDDAVFIHSEDLAVAHDELPVDHDRLDVAG